MHVYHGNVTMPLNLEPTLFTDTQNKISRKIFLSKKIFRDLSTQDKLAHLGIKLEWWNRTITCVIFRKDYDKKALSLGNENLVKK